MNLQKLNKKLLSREVEGKGPMKPGNLLYYKVPIPVDFYLRDERDYIVKSLLIEGFFYCLKTFGRRRQIMKRLFTGFSPYTH